MRRKNKKTGGIMVIAAIVTAFSCGFAAGEKQGKDLLSQQYSMGYQDGINGKIEYLLTEPDEPEQTPAPELVNIGTYTATAYCACTQCCGKTDGITASGVRATAGRTIAADTSRLPFGTEVYIDGQWYVVEDRGGAIKENRIDIYFDSHEEALQYGKKQVELFVKE